MIKFLFCGDQTFSIECRDILEKEKEKERTKYNSNKKEYSADQNTN